jgi:hypothetical protein
MVGGKVMSQKEQLNKWLAELLPYGKDFEKYIKVEEK